MYGVAFEVYGKWSSSQWPKYARPNRQRGRGPGVINAYAVGRRKERKEEYH
jgi:hypothetical protein